MLKLLKLSCVNITWSKVCKKQWNWWEIHDQCLLFVIIHSLLCIIMWLCWALNKIYIVFIILLSMYEGNKHHLFGIWVHNIEYWIMKILIWRYINLPNLNNYNPQNFCPYGTVFWEGKQMLAFNLWHFCRYLELSMGQLLNE